MKEKTTLLVEMVDGLVSAITTSEPRDPFEVIVIDHNVASFRKVPVFVDPNACLVAHTLVALQTTNKRDRKGVKK